MKLTLTGSQTVGPYFSIGMENLCTTAVPPVGVGKGLTVEGRLVDGAGRPIPDGVLELWQADGTGTYRQQPASCPMEADGFARVKTDADGSFRFALTKPGCVPYDSDRLQAPHILVLVYMRGMLRHLVTRVYLPDEPMNETDPVLGLVPAERRSTLIAKRTDTMGVLRWDIVMRSEDAEASLETVFFAW